jgi:hypothetical protein
MADTDHNEGRWLRLAEESRELAEDMADPHAKKQMIIIAKSYLLLDRYSRILAEIDVPDRLKR